MSAYQVKYISNTCGETDELQNQPHESVAKSLFTLLTTHQEIKHPVIGLEGSWGSGKSRVINILQRIFREQGAQNPNATKFVFHTYDIWSAQEDLTRRSFLDSLLANASKDSTNFNTDQLIKDYERLNATITWRSTKTFPLVRLFYAFALLIPISVFLVKVVEQLFGYCESAPMSYNQLAALLSLVFFVISAGFFFKAFYDEYQTIKNNNEVKTDDKKWFPITRLALSRILYLYKAKDIEKEDYETVIKDEPSISRFQEFFNHVKDGLKPNTQLVVVFDNMDRLSEPQKLMSTWSLLHTFFAENDNAGRIWAIVPYASQQLAELMKKENNNHYTAEFINKTFFTSFRIPEPILGSWKQFLYEKLDAAFTPALEAEEKNMVALIFSRSMAGRTIRPRDIITYVNRLVTLYSQHYFEEIRIRFYAIYTQFEGSFKANSAEAIINHKGFESMTGLFNSRDELSKMLAAIHYNLHSDKALEVVFDKEITSFLQKSYQGHSELEKQYNLLSSNSSFSNHIEEFFNGDIDYKEYNMENVFYLLEQNAISQPTRQRIYTAISDNADNLKESFGCYQTWMNHAFLKYNSTSSNKIIAVILQQSTLVFNDYTTSVIGLLNLQKQNAKLKLDLEEVKASSVPDMMTFYNKLIDSSSLPLFASCRITIDEEVLRPYILSGKSQTELFSKETESLYGLLQVLKQNNYDFSKIRKVFYADSFNVAGATKENVRRTYKVFDILRDDFEAAPNFTDLSGPNPEFVRIPEYLACCISRLRVSAPRDQLANRCFSNVESLPDSDVLMPLLARTIKLDEMLLLASEAQHSYVNGMARGFMLSGLGVVGSIYDMLAHAESYLTGFLKDKDSEFIQILDDNADKFDHDAVSQNVIISPYFCKHISKTAVAEHPIYAKILAYWEEQIKSFTEDDWKKLFTGGRNTESDIIVRLFEEGLFSEPILSLAYPCNAAQKVFASHIVNNAAYNESLFRCWKTAVNDDQVSSLVNFVRDTIEVPARMNAVNKYMFTQMYIQYSSRLSDSHYNTPFFDDFVKPYFTSCPIESLAQSVCDNMERFKLLSNNLDEGRISTWSQLLDNRHNEISKDTPAYTKWASFAEYLK